MFDDISTATPLEIDTELARLYGEAYRVESLIARSKEALSSSVHRALGKSWRDAKAPYRRDLLDQVYNDGSVSVWDLEGLRREEANLFALQNQQAALTEEMRPLIEEYNSRPWTRAYLVTDGHVHSSMYCPTCNKGETPTEFTWLVELADHSEAEIVAAAADRACTVCYPTAPVETAGPSALMTPDERTRAQKREDAAKAKAERLATKIAKGLTEDGSEFKVTWQEQGTIYTRQANGTRVGVPGVVNRTESFKTETAAVQWVVQYVAWDGWNSEKAPGFEQVIAAVAVKHGKTEAEVKSDLEAKVAAKIKRDSRY